MGRLQTTVLSALFAMAALPATADTIQYSADLSGKNEVPAVNTAGTGLVTATLDTQSRMLTWELTFWGLSGPAGAAHFHGPAEAGKNAGVAVGILKAGDALPAKGSATLTPEQMADLMAGRWYANVHTAANAPGEIRGQVMKKN
jgi:hypothetical protein